MMRKSPMGVEDWALLLLLTRTIVAVEAVVVGKKKRWRLHD
jgi:hypothetical protein